MGTNYYRIPSVEEVEQRKARLQERISNMEMTPANIEREFNTIPTGDWEYDNPWGEFTNEINIHLGKRSGGWKFLWNFHDNKYYHDQESLFRFINSGRVVDEYGELIPTHEFIEMALTWCTDGWDLQSYDTEHPRTNWFHHVERYVDGLRISDSTNFS
jgi:hypothetical protein